MRDEENGNQSSLGVPHVLSSLDLLSGRLLGKRRLNIGHGWMDGYCRSLSDQETSDLVKEDDLARRSRP